ncbi:hypothetical protein HDU78_002381 [Chytriomyces hyalinus]|nr:hypothetical protein HDU78_002381 [Chytriomyces hyalinus]
MSVATNSPCIVNAFNNYACASDDFSTILECISTLVDADVGTYQYLGSCGPNRVCGISVLQDGTPSPDCLALSTLQQPVSEQQQQEQHPRRNNNNKDTYGDVKPGEVGGSCTPGTYTCNLEGTTALVCKHDGIYAEQLGMCVSGCSIQCGRPYCDVAPGFVAYCDGQTVGGWVDGWTSTICEDKTTSEWVYPATESCTDKTSLSEECTDKTTTSEECTDKATTSEECTDKSTTSEECTDKETTVDECIEKTTSDCAEDISSNESETLHIYTDTMWGTVTPTQVTTPYSATTATRDKCIPKTETTTAIRDKCVPKTETMTATTNSSDGAIVIPIPIPIIIPIKDKNTTTNASTLGYYDSHAMKGLGGAWVMIGFAAAFHFALDFAFTYFGV